MTALDPRAFATAARVAITAQLAPAHAAWEYGKMPGDPSNPIEAERIKPLPPIFVLVAIERRYNPNLRMTAQAGGTGWRLLVRAAGRSSSEASWALLKVAEALNENRLTVEGVTTTPIQFETETAPRLDETRFVGDAAYVFAH